MKRLFVILFIILVIGLSIFIIVSPKKDSSNEEDFNNSGRAKAILDEKDLWMVYEGDGFTIKYPHDVILNPVSGPGLYILSHKTNEEPSPLPKFNLEGTEQILNINGEEVETFMTLGRFEACSVILEREADFFMGDELIMIVLREDPEIIKNEHSNFFTTDEENCGDELIWNDKVGFWNMLKTGNGGEQTQSWFNKFDEIIETLEFDEVSIIGTWQATDDDKSVVEFKGSEKIDYYNGEEMSRDSYVITFDKLTAGEFEYSIVELTKDKLILTYLPRGNTLVYTRIN